MGITRFSGPVYGALGILATAHTTSIATSASAAEFYEVTVPASEDWYVTSAQAYCTNQGNAATVDVQDDGASIFGAAMTLVTNGPSTGGTITNDQTEEGKKIAASSAVTFKGTNGITTAAANVTVVLYGWRRRVD